MKKLITHVLSIAIMQFADEQNKIDSPIKEDVLIM